LLAALYLNFINSIIIIIIIIIIIVIIIIVFQTFFAWLIHTGLITITKLLSVSSMITACRPHAA
jgi:hypothetical protein